MSHLTRRHLLGAAATGAAAGALTTATGAPAGASTKPGSTQAATVIKNARVWTGTGTMAEAVAIGTDGRIMGVGTSRAMGKYVGNQTVVLSAAGRTVISGIHDGHVHPTAVVQYLIYPTLEDAQLTLAAMQSALNGFLASPSTVFRGDWLFVLGWNPVACPVDALPAVKQYLDELDNPTNRPIILRGSDGHNSFVNSRALEIAGIDDSTPNPSGGVIVRDAGGHATGVLVDTAQDLVMSAIPSLTAAEQLPWFGAISGYMASMGITSFQDAWVTPESLELYAMAGAQGLMRQRAQAMLLLPEEYFGNPAAGLAWAEGLAQAYAGTPWLSIRTIKIFLDGVMEFPAQTAALIDPYLAADGTPTANRGNLYVDTATLSSIITVFDRAGWQVHMHAIGDRAVRTGLDAVAAARAANPGSAVRHTMAHLQLIDPADYGRFAALGVIPDFQLQWACSDYWTNEALHPYIGDDRYARLYPAHSVWSAGGALAGGSDWPVDPLAPWNQVATAVDRIGLGGLPSSGAGGTGLPLDPDQAIPLDVALAMHTRGTAHQMYQEARTGTVVVGKDADLQVLDVDATVVSTRKLALANVVRTFRAGATTWDSTGPDFQTTPAKRKQVEAAAAAAGAADNGCGCTRRH
jgi:predicted amidohydrolase YtcJ